MFCSGTDRPGIQESNLPISQAEHAVFPTDMQWIVRNIWLNLEHWFIFISIRHYWKKTRGEKKEKCRQNWSQPYFAAYDGLSNWPQPLATVGQAAQAIFKCPRTRKTVGAAIRCASSTSFMFPSICMFLSVMAVNFRSLQHACTFTCLFDQLVVLLPMVFLTVHYIIPHETEQAYPAFFFSLFTAFFSRILCTVPKFLLGLTI